MVMINDILLPVRNRLESALQAAHARDEDWIKLTNLSGLDGAVGDEQSNRIVMAVSAIQHDTSLGTYQQPRGGTGDGFGMASAPMYFDVHVLFASCFVDANYAAGIGVLSRIIEYLQEYPVFDAASSPEIGALMGNLWIDSVSLDASATSHLATFMGLKGQPFVVFRLRRLPFAGPSISGVAPAVKQAPPPVMMPRG